VPHERVVVERDRRLAFALRAVALRERAVSEVELVRELLANRSGSLGRRLRMTNGMTK
jgi:hypothetical protein